MADDMHYKKRNIDARSIETIAKHLLDQCKAEHSRMEEKPITADTAGIDVNE